jgi:hypothetical protein
MTVPVAEVMVLETWHMAELEPQIAVAELEHATTPAEVTEVPRFEAWGMSELECGTAVAEVARLESPRLSKDTPAVELEALVSQVQLRPGVSRKMPKAEVAVSCLGRLRYDPERR